VVLLVLFTSSLFPLLSAALPDGTETLVLKITVFWIVTPYSLVNVYGRLICTPTSYIYSVTYFIYLFIFVLYFTVRDWGNVVGIETRLLVCMIQGSIPDYRLDSFIFCKTSSAAGAHPA
jgi:hypothetical protein